MWRSISIYFTQATLAFRSVRRVLTDHGLSTWCFTPEQVLYPINIASSDDDLRSDSIERFYQAADICAILGARYLFLTSGRGYEFRSSPECAWERTVNSLARIAEHARRSGVRCVLEPLRAKSTPTYLLDAKGLRRMLDDIGADNIDVVLDTVAMATAGDTGGGLPCFLRLQTGACADRRRHAGRPSGMGGRDTAGSGRYVSELTESGYAGKITFGPFGNGSYALDPVAAWKRNLAAIEPYLDRVSVSA